LKLDNLDLSLTGLRDALRGANSKTLTDLDTDLANIYSRLDVVLSTRASESTLSSIYGRLDVALSTRLADSKIPNVLGQVSTDVVGSTMYALAVLDKSTPSRMPHMVDNIAVGTTSSSTSIAAPGGKIVKITNKGDVDVLIGINADVPASNPVVVRARTYKIFIHHSVTSIYYKVSSGSSVISIEWWN